MPTYRLDLAYDGSSFHGYARQAGLRTVQGELEEALLRLTGQLDTSVAGRTDAGVHAHGQVVSFKTEQELDTESVARSLNRVLNPEIVATGLIPVAEGFHARFSALSRTYRYRILNQPLPEPLLRHTVWHVGHPLSLPAMDKAAGLVLGEHDFASFCRAIPGRSSVRRVLEARWEQPESALVVLAIRANSFCQQMVRSFVAASVEVGRGRLSPEGVAEMLEARDRRTSSGVAPPHGLTLWEVEY